MTRRGQRSRGHPRVVQGSLIDTGNTAVEEVPREVPVPKLFQQGSSGPPRVIGVVSMTSRNGGPSTFDRPILQSWTEDELRENGWQASEMRFNSNSIMAVQRAFEETDSRITLDKAQSSHIGSGGSSKSIDGAATMEAKAHLNHLALLGLSCAWSERARREGSKLPADEGEVTDALPVARTVLELDRRALAHISASDASSLARAFRQHLSRSPSRRNWARLYDEEFRERKLLLRQVKELGMSSTIDNSNAGDSDTAEVDDEVPARALAEWSLNLAPTGRVEDPDQDGKISGDSQWGGASGPSFVADISDTNILPPELLTAGSLGRLDDTVDRLSPKEIRLAATMLRNSTILTDSATPTDRLTGQTGTDDSTARTASPADRRSISPVAGPGTYRGRGVQGSSETPYVGRQIGTPAESTGKSWGTDSSLPPLSAPPMRPPPSEPRKGMKALQSAINTGNRRKKVRDHRFAGPIGTPASVASPEPEVVAPMSTHDDGCLQIGSEDVSDTARQATETSLMAPTCTATADLRSIIFPDLQVALAAEDADDPGTISEPEGRWLQAEDAYSAAIARNRGTTRPFYRSEGAWGAQDDSYLRSEHDWS